MSSIRKETQSKFGTLQAPATKLLVRKELRRTSQPYEFATHASKPCCPSVGDDIGDSCSVLLLLRFVFLISIKLRSCGRKIHDPSKSPSPKRLKISDKFVSQRGCFIIHPNRYLHFHSAPNESVAFTTTEDCGWRFLAHSFHPLQ
jgi:hypothetical protein